MKTAHTALPWALNRDEVPPLIYANHNDENGQKCIALFDGHAAFPGVHACEANAEFIVRACNAHDDLVRALQFAVARVKVANSEGNPILSAWLADAEAAITKAGSA